MNKKKNIEDIYPLSPMQQGILFHSILNPDSDIYTPQVCLTLEGDINPNSIKQAWQEIINRHQLCRAAFHWEKKDKTFQVIYKQVELPWIEKDWREYSLEEQEKLLTEFLTADKKQGFNLKRSPLIRLGLIRLRETTYKLIWTQHHLILDGWSSSLILKEFFTIYNGLPCQTAIPYGQYIAWLNNQDLERAKTYWRDKLQGLTEPTSLKIYGQKIEENKTNQSQNLKLSSTITNYLKSLSKKYNLTLNTIIQGAFAILLSRYTNCNDIIYGTTTSGRSASFPGIESMVGLFINTLPMRIKLSDTELLLPWLEKLQQQQVENLQYEYTPLSTIQELSDIRGGVPLFENIFVFENYPYDPKLLAKNKKLKVKSIYIQESNSFPLTCLVKLGSELSIEIQYDNTRFALDTIIRILEYFEHLLTQIANDPQQPLGRLSILTARDKELIEYWQQTQINYPLDQTIPELLNEQVKKTPEATALIFKTQKYTYQQLNNRADELANYLTELGVKPETPIGIYLERSEKMAIAILAIIKAGGAYVPLDPNYPENRINFIIEDTQINIVLTETKYQKNFNSNDITIINLDSSGNSYVSQGKYPSPLQSHIHPDNTAYIIYTSGSTGKPKGVINSHRGLVNRLLWMQDAYQLDGSDRVLQKTPFSFDVSVWEFFWTWLNGACLVIAKPEGHKDSNYLVKLINEAEITVIHFVPSMLQVFLEESNVSSCKSLKQVICSGEALPVNVKDKFLAKLDAQLHNLYGPTEAAIDVTFYQCNNDENDFVPIGGAIANTQIYILNAQQQINPIGVPGELHIAGVGLARGYLNRPELTAEKFIPNPVGAGLINSGGNLQRQPLAHRDGPLLYKTGDLACYLPDGNIQFLGRIDNNVKVRGFRIELGEIETVLEQHPAVQQSVVIIREDVGIDPKIVAYLTGNQNVVQGINQDLIKSKLRNYLESELPYYMIPDAFVLLEEFPLNVNGKLDRKALPKPQITTKTFIPPRNSLEEKIATVWQNILQLEKVSIDDNFFELGGNSLSATRVNSRLREVLSIELPLRIIFEKPTIAGIAERIQLMERAVEKSFSILSEVKRQELEI